MHTAHFAHYTLQHTAHFAHYTLQHTAHFAHYTLQHTAHFAHYTRCQTCCYSYHLHTTHDALYTRCQSCCYSHIICTPLTMHSSHDTNHAAIHTSSAHYSRCTLHTILIMLLFTHHLHRGVSISHAALPIKSTAPAQAAVPGEWAPSVASVVQ
jgi:hypothetical protein